VLDGVQDHFTESSLGVFETTNIFPSSSRDLDNSLSKTGWVGSILGKLEVFVCD
jgi:hypothetical protein